MGSPGSAEEPLYDFCVAESWEHEPTDGVIYVNWVRYLASPYDLSLDVGYRTDPVPPREFPVRLVMSWEQAKILRLLLEDAVDGFEANVGPIREIEGGPGDAVDPTAAHGEESS